MEQQIRILIIDDDEVDRMTVIRGLKKALQKVEITQAADGEEGLLCVQQKEFDCVFLDYRLPATDGLSILRQLRSTGFRTPIIMLTRLGDEEMAVEMMKAGASDYLSKDRMNPETLAKSVQYVIRTHQAEQQLRESQERYEVAVHGAKDGIWDWDMKKNTIFFSPRWKALLGYEDDEIPNTPSEWFNRIHPEDRQMVQEQLNAHLEGRTLHLECEYRMLHKDGHYRWVLTRGLAMRDPAGNPTRIAGSQTDITERKKYEAERERLYQQALEADRRKDEFLAVVSHELRTPLTAILGWVQLMQSGKISAENFSRGLQIIEKNAKLQTRLVEDLLDVSRILKGNLQLNLRKFQLPALVDMVLETILSSAKIKAIEIEKEIQQPISPLLADPDRMHQILWNLLSNAIKFTPRGGKIIIQLRQEGEEAILRVTDTGCGISSQFLPHVFDPFRQEENPNTRSQGGLGLGLSITRHLVQLHGGKIDVASEGPGKGATFTVRLPTISESSAGEFAWEPVTSQISSTVLDGLQILIVEDDADTLEIIVSALQLYGATVQAVTSVEEAMKLLNTSFPHLLISDIAMPGQDGYSLLSRIRSLEQKKGQSLPVIAVTAYATSEDRMRALKAGFQAHITKPIEAGKLAAVIAELVTANRKEPHGHV